MREQAPELDHDRSVERAGGREVTVLAFRGDLDLAVVAALASALEAGADGDAGEVVDLTGVRFIDSAGIHVMVRARESAHAAGRRFELVVPPESNVDRVLEITGLSEHLETHASREAALAAVAAGGGDAV
jgi:anti-anti-sigma factor